MRRLSSWAVILAFASSGCTIYHSKQALSVGSAAPPRADATFITEEDSGLMIAGVITLTEPDHYAVLLERARRRHQCARLSHAQLDFFTDFWIVVAFPITRMTLICERAPAIPAPAPRAVPR